MLTRQVLAYPLNTGVNTRAEGEKIRPNHCMSCILSFFLMSSHKFCSLLASLKVACLEICELIWYLKCSLSLVLYAEELAV